MRTSCLCRVCIRDTYMNAKSEMAGFTYNFALDEVNEVHEQILEARLCFQLLQGLHQLRTKLVQVRLVVA